MKTKGVSGMWLTLSVLAAISFGLRGILYHWTSKKPINRNLLLCGTFCTGAIIHGICAVVFSSNWTIAALIGIQMGLFSFGANASMFKGFAVGKASIVAILTALPSVVVVLVAFGLWDERLHLMQIVAFMIIVGGALLVRLSNDLSLKNLQGAQWGLLAMLLFAGNDLSGKWSTLEEADLFATMFCMFVTGALCFGIWWLRDREKERRVLLLHKQMQGEAASAGAVIADRDHAQDSGGAGITGGDHAQDSGGAVSPNAATGWSGKRTFATGLAIGITNAVGMMFIVTAFSIGKAGLVSAVTALNVLIVLLYTRFVIKEKFTHIEIAGISLAFLGIVLMRLFGA
ncbi:EamA family transporter [Paenibacillus sp. CAU 1782]